MTKKYKNIKNEKRDSKILSMRELIQIIFHMIEEQI